MKNLLKISVAFFTVLLLTIACNVGEVNQPYDNMPGRAISAGDSFTIEAESYVATNGVTTETCSEGGLNVTSIDTGDWMAYDTMYYEEGTYLIEFRVAAKKPGGKMSVDLDAGSIVIGGVDVPRTGGDQTWTTVSTTAFIPGGDHALGIYASSGGWNLNWIKFTYQGNDSGSTPPSGTYTLVWSDEFDGTSLDTTNWSYDKGGSGWGNNELQYYTDRTENVKVENGYLQITALKESYRGKSYTSGRIKTQDKVFKTYGKVEARLRLSNIGSGLWPAFWMLGNNISTVSWPACGEIDLMEHVNLEDVIYGTAHWDVNGSHVYYGNSYTADITQWHVYTIEWDNTAIRWYVDGVQYHEMNITDSVNSTEEFHAPFFILFNIAVGGNWPGFDIDDAMFPVTMYVDWVRWYQLQ